VRRYLLQQVWWNDLAKLVTGSARVVELGHELPAGGTGSREVFVACLELELQVENLLFQVSSLLAEGVDVSGGTEPGLAPCLVAQSLGQAFFQVMDGAAEPHGTFMCHEGVSLQRGPGDSGTGAVAGGGFGLEGVDPLQQVAVPVDERHVGSGGAGDSGGADLGAFCGGTVECGGDALAAPEGVGLAAFQHGLGLGGIHAVASGISVCGCAGAEAGYAEGDSVSGAATAHHRDGFVDLGALSVVKAGEVALDLGDQVPHPRDLLLRGGGVGTGPFIGAGDGGGQSLPPPEQVLEVGLQVGREGDVGAEMVAARAAEPDRAGAPPTWTLECSAQVP
jgi:hypothetical protein